MRSKIADQDLAKSTESTHKANHYDHYNRNIKEIMNNIVKIKWTLDSSDNFYYITIIMIKHYVYPINLA